jgi:polyhydroxyalkanoate synthesis regulator phasin
MIVPARPAHLAGLAAVLYCARMKDTDIEAKIDDLARMVADGFTEVRAEFKTVRAEMQEMGDELRSEFKSEMARLRGDLDIMLDKHIGVFRKDFDELAARVKRLEALVLK